MIVSGRASSLEELTYERLESDILDGVYKKGEALTELALCARLGVSRTPVRSALHRLAEDGLIEIIPNRGAVVVGVTAEDLISTYKIRMRLEGLASSLAAVNITEAELRALTESIELSEYYIKKSDAEHLKELDTEFHSIIYGASGSRMLCKILSDLHKNIKSYRKLSLTVPGRLEASQREHAEILAAIREGNADLADELTSRHIERAMDNIKSTLA